jgi:xylose isomerase
MNPETTYRFSFGPWNISEGADPFGPPIRSAFPHEEKFALYRPNGFDGVQFHDDDVVPDIENKSASQIEKEAHEVATMLKNQGLVAEFVAPRLWFAPETVDGGYTSNRASDRESAWERTRRSVDIARAVGAKAIVFWFAREGTYMREAKDAKLAYERIQDMIDKTLAYDPEIELWIEPKPNEPTDVAYVPTTGHALALSYASSDPRRVKALIESAHAMLAGLDASDEMAFALAHDKLGSVHLNDQNGLKYDQDKNFGSANLRSAFDQVLVLEDAKYGSKGEFIGLDVKAMRTQPGVPVMDHLINTRKLFFDLLEKVRTYDRAKVQALRDDRDYEGLELYTLRHIMGLR